MINQEKILGVIGGSGVYEIDGLQNTQWKKVVYAMCARKYLKREMI